MSAFDDIRAAIRAECDEDGFVWPPESSQAVGAANLVVRIAAGLLERERASRQAWAEEAMRMDHIAERMALAAGMNDDRLRFVASRYLADGSGLNFRDTRCTGVSSDALAWFAVGRRDEPKLSEYPLDPSDLAACERTYEMAPEFLRERMEPVLARYRAAVAKDYPEVGPGPQCAVHPDSGVDLPVEGGGPTHD